MSIFANLQPGQNAGGPPAAMGPASAPAPQMQPPQQNTQGWPQHVPQPAGFGGSNGSQFQQQNFGQQQPQNFGQQGYGQPQPMPQQQSFGGFGGGGSIFAAYTPQQMAAAKPTSNAIYAKPGRYIVRIERFKTGRRQREGNEAFCAIEQTVVAVLQADVDGNRVGEVVTDFKKAGQYFLGEMKGAVGGIMDKDEQETESITLQDLEFVCGPHQPLAGIFVEKNNFLKPVKNPKAGSPGVFTVNTYVRSVPPEEVAALVDPQTAASLGIQLPAGAAPNLPPPVPAQQPMGHAPQQDMSGFFGGGQQQQAPQGAFAAGAFFGQPQQPAQ